MNPMMACGHTANSVDQNNDPGCAICFGIDPDASIVVEAPNLEGRRAFCSDCGKSSPSRLDLPFFEYCSELKDDRMYCGCRGWD